MINHEYKFIFVHINKTGGTSIEKMFESDADEKNIPRKHAPIAYYRRKYPLKYLTYYKFGFVRNPWDWLVSRYHWSRDKQQLFGYDFEEMMNRMDRGIALADDAPWMEEEALLPQFSRLSIRGKLAVDFVGRFEHLQADFETICARIGRPPEELPHVFASGRAGYVDYYDDRTRAIVERLYRDDIEAFGYRFGD